MELKNKIQVCKSLEELPTIEKLNSIPRGVEYQFLLDENINEIRQIIGQEWKNNLPDFQVAVHTFEPKITVTKIITVKEIEDHQDFFERCARDYRELATELIIKLVNKFNLKIFSDNLMITLNSSGRSGYKQVGKLYEWNYFFHGIHCGFKNTFTGQIIEVPLNFGLEFGELDPYFFTRFIKSTGKYYPLPIDIYLDYEDGRRILNTMIDLGKYELIKGNFPNTNGIVVKNREEVTIEDFNLKSNSVSESNSRKFWSIMKNFWS